MIDIEELKSSLPSTVAKNVSTDVIDTLNQALASDPSSLEIFREQLYNHGDVLKQGKYKFSQYLDACKFVTFTLFNQSNQEAWCKTFPDRYARLKVQGADAKTISAHVAAFNKTKLVNEIRKRNMIHDGVMYADIRYKNIKVLDTIASDDTMPSRDRVAAATSLLNHLKMPEEQTVKLDVTHEAGNSMLDILRATSASLVQQQKALIQQGTSVKDITESGLVINHE